MTTVVQCIGECMIEFSRTDATSGAQVRYAGDAFNTAVYLRRTAAELGVDVDVRFLTGVGVDDESVRMRDYWKSEGVGDDALVVADRHPGAYLVTTDEDGERDFLYWRRRSAAARVFSGSEWLSSVRGDVVYLSGITLQLLDDAQVTGLVEALRAVRARGGVVAFDSNFRPGAWPNPAKARVTMARVLAKTDIALVTLTDEIELGRARDVDSCITALEALGVREVVVKVGAAGAWVLDGHRAVHVPTEPVDAVDTTAAGDSFNGGYLAARLAGAPPLAAAAAGNRVARAVVRGRGAIVAHTEMPTEGELTTW